MPSARAPDVTRLLLAWRDGDNAALERLAPFVYRELRKLAHARLRAESPHASIDTTDLVHEAYLRLVDARSVSWQDRTHFYALCARAMRRILVDSARRRRSLKRGGAVLMVPLEKSLAVSSDRDSGLLALDEALAELSAADPRQAQVVELSSPTPTRSSRRPRGRSRLRRSIHAISTSTAIRCGATRRCRTGGSSTPGRTTSLQPCRPSRTSTSSRTGSHN